MTNIIAHSGLTHCRTHPHGEHRGLQQA